ncbi:MAG: L,D-transpeptidase family protein, partial [Allosphingosinicella sp.]
MLSRSLLAAALLLPLAACEQAPARVQPAAPTVNAAAPLQPVKVSAEIAAFYRERGARPLWVDRRGPRPEAVRLAGEIARAADHGLDPTRYDIAGLAAALEAAGSGEPTARARADLLLSRAYAAFVRDLRVPARGKSSVVWVDEELAPEPPEDGALLEAAAAAPDLGRHLAEATAMNPLYTALSRGYARRRAAGPLSAAEAEAIRSNLDRARLIPALPGRYVIVDAGSARLWMIDGDKVEGPMRVIVGKRGMQTPNMAGYIRYVTLNPWWNVPPDLARERAKRVLKSGPGILMRENMELLSDWSDRPRVIQASQVNWKAVASGRTSLRMRQRPGGANVMGAMKFMLPNSLGIYLHDFPDKSLFARADRRISSGCVRLE